MVKNLQRLPSVGHPFITNKLKGSKVGVSILVEEVKWRLLCHYIIPYPQSPTHCNRCIVVVLLYNDNQAQTWLIITINDTSIGDLPLIITISDTCKNQPKTLDFDNTINLSSLIVSLVVYVYISRISMVGSVGFVLSEISGDNWTNLTKPSEYAYSSVL